jgi:Holliday junction DNA helicase RuvA
MVLELRDKLPPTQIGETPATPVMSVIEEDVLSALVNLGYQRPAAERALATAAKNEKEPTFEALFRNTLAALAK